MLKASLFYERSNQYKKAIDELELLLDQRGYDDDVLMQINQIYLKENKVEQSAQTIRRMISANPHDAKYYTLLAEMYLSNKHDEESLQTLKKKQNACFPEILRWNSDLPLTTKEKTTRLNTWSTLIVRL
ncbi:MAG: hypothetical protein QM743_09700 [Chitinophagaceae bacterium]